MLKEACKLRTAGKRKRSVVEQSKIHHIYIYSHPIKGNNEVQASKKKREKKKESWLTGIDKC